MLPQPHPMYVSRPLWLRLGEALADQGRSIVAAVREAAERRQSRAQRVRDRAALRHLSRHLLRDIGADDDLLAAASERESTRAAFAQAWRHGL